MAALRSTERATLGRRALQSVRRISGDQYQSFRLIVYLAISVFVLLYVFTVKGVETLLDQHFKRVVEESVQVPDLHRSVTLQIQSEIDNRIRQSPWVRIAGVRVTVIVLGHDGTYIYAGGRALPPPPDIDPASLLREAEKLLPATAEVIVSVPHNTLLSNGILLLYTAILLQGLFIYQRVSTRRGRQSLRLALKARDLAFGRAREIEDELTSVRQQFQDVEPAEQAHSQEIRSLHFERKSLQRKLRGLAAREEELRGKAEKAVELDQERLALEELLEEASGEISSRDEEITKLQSSLQKAARGADRLQSSRTRETDQLGRRLRALYRNVEFDDRSIEDLTSLRDEAMKLKAETVIKRLCDEADNVAVRRKVGGLPDHLTIFELGFAGKGRIYYTRGRSLRFRVLAIGAKNSQNADLDYLSRLPKE